MKFIRNFLHALNVFTLFVPFLVLGCAHQSGGMEKTSAVRDIHITKQANRYILGSDGKVVAEIVRVEALGATLDEAKRNAFFLAVQQVVGTLVDAVRVVEDDTISLNRILTASDGFVEEYDLVTQEVVTGGAFRVEILAKVRRGLLSEQLLMSNIPVSEEVIGENLFAKALTQQTTMQEAGEILQSLLHKDPRNFDVKIIKPLEVIDVGQLSHEELRISQTWVSCELEIKLNDTYYREVFIPKLLRLLDLISGPRQIVFSQKATPDIKMNFTESGYSEIFRDNRSRHRILTFYNVTPAAEAISFREVFFESISRKAKGFLTVKDEGVFIFVKNIDGNDIIYYYKISPFISNIFKDKSTKLRNGRDNRYNMFAKRFGLPCRISFISDGRIIYKHSFEVQYTYSWLYSNKFSSQKLDLNGGPDGLYNWVITPYFIDDGENEMTRYFLPFGKFTRYAASGADTHDFVSLRGEIKIPLTSRDMLKKVDSIKAQAGFDPDDGIKNR